MNLRARLFVAGLALSLPFAIAVGWGVTFARASAAEDALAQHALAVADASRAACEASPEAWGGDALGRPISPGASPVLSLFAYDASLRATNTRAPPLPSAVRASLERGKERAWFREGRLAGVVVRAPWGEGPCAYFLVERRFGASMPGGGPPFVVPALSVGFVIAVMMALLGPVVARIRRLREEVSASARAGYSARVTAGGADEIAELAAAFDEASRQIEAHIADRERRERTLRDFVASTTHDVMVPLTVLQGHVARLRERAARDVAVEPSIVRAMVEELSYLTSLVHNLGAAAKLDAGEPSIVRAPIDLTALVSRAISRQAALARELEVSLDFATPASALVVVGDVTLIEQAFGNLIQNALRYNRAGGHVAVVLEPHEEGRFRLAVMDDGPGIPEDEVHALLERGARGDAARTRHPHGQGLGLSIVKRVVDAHGFILSFAPGEGGGLTVAMTGPVAQA